MTEGGADRAASGPRKRGAQSHGARGMIALRQLGLVRLLMTLFVLLLAFLAARFAWHVPLAIEAERALYDWRHVATAPEVGQDPRIVQVVYTDETLAATGKRSPLDRAMLAKALRRIESISPRAIGIDILIDQPQPEDPEAIAAFRSLKTPTSLAFASADTAEDKIMLWQEEFLQSFMASLAPGNVRPASIMIEADDDNVLRSWPERRAAAAELLPVSMAPESGSRFRNYSGSVQYRLPLYNEVPVFAALPIDTFAQDALFENPDAAELFRKQIEGKYILIGGHIQDIDLFETPLNRVTGKPTWGIEVFAHMLAQQLDGRLPKAIPLWMETAAAITIVLLAGLTALSNARSLLIGGLILVQLAMIALIPFYLQANNVDTQGLPAFGWSAGWFIAFAAVGNAARAIGSEQRKFAQSALGKYLPRDIAAEILRDPESLTLHGEKREIFVVFTDLEGFTKLSHAIDPEMVATLLNRYLDILSEVVLRYGGTIDKFVGDSVGDADGERAARAAFAMHEAGEAFRRNVPEGVPAIGKTRVGLHHGEAIVGNFGGEGRIQYTALGDSMNTAARLEAANKQTRSNVLVSREAAERSGLDLFRPLGRVVLRGRATPVDIFEPAPDLSEGDRRHFVALAERAQNGDVSAVTAIEQISAKQPNDAALAHFVYRLHHQEEGGYFVLD